MLNGSQSFFLTETISEEDKARLKTGDLHISGWLPGKQNPDTKDLARLKESSAIKDYSSWLTGLSRLNLDSARRSFRCIPNKLTVKQKDCCATMNFSLTKGCFATSLIRELVLVRDKQLGARSLQTDVKD